MASDAQTLENLIATLKYPGMSSRDVLLAMAGYYGTAANMNAQQAVVVAAQQKYAALSDIDLDEALLAYFIIWPPQHNNS